MITIDNYKIDSNYFNWILDRLNTSLVYNTHDYTELLNRLNNIEFTILMTMDHNRYNDGLDLRNEYEYETHMHNETDPSRPCSILEMMAALAIRCEDSIMTDPLFGDRTGLWFWEMIESLGLIDFSDYVYTKSKNCHDYVDNVIDIFLNREYDYDGQGGLFSIKNSTIDMRTLEIWSQMQYSLNEKHY